MIYYEIQAIYSEKEYLQNVRIYVVNVHSQSVNCSYNLFCISLKVKLRGESARPKTQFPRCGITAPHTSTQ